MAAPQSHDVAMFESDTLSHRAYSGFCCIQGRSEVYWVQNGRLGSNLLASFVPSNSLVGLVKAHCALGLSGEGTDMWSRK